MSITIGDQVQLSEKHPRIDTFSLGICKSIEADKAQILFDNSETVCVPVSSLKKMVRLFKPVKAEPVVLAAPRTEEEKIGYIMGQTWLSAGEYSLNVEINFLEKELSKFKRERVLHRLEMRKATAFVRKHLRLSPPTPTNAVIVAVNEFYSKK